LRRLLHEYGMPAESRLLSAEQTNSSVGFEASFVLKVFRRLEEGQSLDLEIGRYLSDRNFPHSPAVAGAIEYRRNGIARTVAVLQQYVQNEGDAWDLMGDAVAEAFERAAAREQPTGTDTVTTATLLRAAAVEPAEAAREVAGTAIEHARIIGQRTAQLHRTLGSESTDPAFAPESFTMFYQRSLYQSMRNLAGRTFLLLGKRIDTLPALARADAMAVLALEDRLLARLRRLIDGKLHGQRIRTHGDYHLGQVLFTGRDFVITDFEGEPARPLSERRIKRSPLRDVAGMLRSFHYAAYSAVLEGHMRAEDSQERVARTPWAEAWYGAVASAFVRAYLETIEGTPLLPEDVHEVEILLDAYLLEKAVYELAYEMNNRPGWAAIPLLALRQLLEQ
jgi:maltose alpha-D-glucosyltransferase/alpha-amylase